MRTIHSQAMKGCDLTNTDIRSGENSTMITFGITLDEEQYVWTNRKRRSSQYPYDSAAEQNDTDIKGLKKLKTTYAQLAQTGKYKKYRCCFKL